MGGLIFTYVFHDLFLRGINADDGGSLVMTLASFVLPFLLTLGLNYALSMMKIHKRKKHGKQKVYSSFFDTVDAGGILRADVKK